MTFTHEFVLTDLHFWSIYLGLSKQNQGKCFENTEYSKHMHKQPVATGLKWNKSKKKITQWRVYLCPLIMIWFLNVSFYIDIYAATQTPKDLRQKSG
jgi:hypothetical protein